MSHDARSFHPNEIVAVLLYLELQLSVCRQRTPKPSRIFQQRVQVFFLGMLIPRIQGRYPCVCAARGFEWGLVRWAAAHLTGSLAGREQHEQQ